MHTYMYYNSRPTATFLNPLTRAASHMLGPGRGGGRLRKESLLRKVFSIGIYTTKSVLLV
jgi:hypothetical protein